MATPNQANVQPIAPYYGIQLIDDIHNYFPALLYDRNSFRTVQDVLGYIHHRVDSRFNLLTRAENSYNRMNQSVQRPATRSVSPAPSRVVHRRVNPPTVVRAPVPAPYTDSPVSRSTSSSVNQAFTLPLRTPPRTIVVNEIHESDTTDNLEEGEIDQSQPSPSDRSVLANQILQLIGITDHLTLPINTGLEYMYLTNLLMPQNLEPVLVTPTIQEIEQGTQLLQANPAHESQNCSICQDSFTEGQAIRKFRVCQHEFHRNCIDVWFQRNVHCPVCRHDVRANVVN